MDVMYKIIFSYLNKWRIARARLRALLFQLQGSRVEGKCLFSERVRIDRPWLVSIGRRTQLEADVWLKIVSDQAQVQIGEYTFIGRGTEIDASASVLIGSRVLIAPGVFITDHSHNTAPGQLIDAQGCTAAPVFIEDDVWLGTRCVIMAGVRIGRGAVVGAGAIVTKDVPENAIVAGVPAKILRYRSDTV